MIAELVVPPMLEKPLGLGRDTPLAGRQSAPGVHVAANLIDDRIGIIPLLLRGDSLALIEDHLVLIRRAFALLRFRDGSDKLRRPPFGDFSLGRLSVLVEFPVLLRALVGRVQDGVIEEGVGHR